MHFRKFITIWALLAIMFGQVALVQHSATHIEHGFSQEIVASYDDHHHHHDEDQHDEDNEPHECSECFLINSLQTAFYNDPVTLPVVLEAEYSTLFEQSFIASNRRYTSNPPRAPPTFLI